MSAVIKNTNTYVNKVIWRLLINLFIKKFYIEIIYLTRKILILLKAN
jgi:hypothetical protein